MKKKLLLLFILLHSLSAFSPAQAKMSKEANTLYTQAIIFENDNRFEDAIDLIHKA